MRYVTVGLIVLFSSDLAWSDNPDTWGAWDELPSDVLDLSGETDPQALSRHLDQLIEDDPDSEELDQLLEAWLRQSAVPGNGRRMPLQSLIGLSKKDINALPEAERQRLEDQLDELLSDLPDASNHASPPGLGGDLDNLPNAPGQNPGNGGGSGNGPGNQGNGPPSGTPNGN